MEKGRASLEEVEVASAVDISGRVKGGDKAKGFSLNVFFENPMYIRNELRLHLYPAPFPPSFPHVPPKCPLQNICTMHLFYPTGSN